MSRRVVLLVAASLSCTRPNPLFALSEGSVADDDDDDDGGPATGPTDGGSGGPTTGGTSSPPATSDGPVGSTSGEPTGTATEGTSGLTEPVDTTTTGPDTTGGDTCATDCIDPDQECLGGLMCTGKLEWLKRSGDAELQRASDAAVLSDGSVVVVGNFTGELGTAPNVITTTTDPVEGDGFILCLDPTGEQKWIRHLGGIGLQAAHAVVALPEDRIAVAGRFTGQLEFEPHQIDGVGSGPAFVAVLDAAGVSSTVHVLGGDDVVAHDIAVGPTGEVVVVGSYAGDILVAGDKTTSIDRDLFAVGLDLVGGPKWSWLPTAAGDQSANAVAVAPSGAVFVGGELTTGLMIGDIALLGEGVDGFVAGLDDLGVPQWSERIGGPADDRVRAIAAAPDGSLVVTGVHGGGLDFGAGVVPVPGGGALGGYIAAFDGDGDLRWGRSGFLLGAEPSGVAIDHTGRVVVALTVGDQPIDLGGGPLGDVPGTLLVKLTSAGNFVWGRHLAGPVAPTGAGLGVGTAGEIAVTGAFDLTLAHDPLEVVSAGQLDVFAGRFLP